MGGALFPKLCLRGSPQSKTLKTPCPRCMVREYWRIFKGVKRQGRGKKINTTNLMTAGNGSWGLLMYERALLLCVTLMVSLQRLVKTIVLLIFVFYAHTCTDLQAENDTIKFLYTHTVVPIHKFISLQFSYRQGLDHTLSNIYRDPAIIEHEVMVFYNFYNLG